MKKKLLLSIIIATSLICSCGSNSNNIQDPYDANNGNKSVPNRFGIIETHYDNSNMTWYVVYDKKTGVEYMLIGDHIQYGITPLYNSDGTLMVYDEVL